VRAIKSLPHARRRLGRFAIVLATLGTVGTIAAQPVAAQATQPLQQVISANPFGLLLDSGTYFGFGFDTNWSWLLGKNDNFYVGIGFGLKRLLGTPEDDDSFDLETLPTIRIINVGFAF
jgi:hypothetical protein